MGISSRSLQLGRNSASRSLERRTRTVCQSSMRSDRSDVGAGGVTQLALESGDRNSRYGASMKVYGAAPFPAGAVLGSASRILLASSSALSSSQPVAGTVCDEAG